MALSEVAICNQALARVGSSEFINSLDEPTTEARACKVLYADARDAVLVAGPWPFATRRALLAEIAGSGVPPYAGTETGWAFRYALPADCLVAREVWAGERNPLAPIPFATGYGSTGRVLLADVANAQLEYTAVVVTPAAFDPGFTDALAWRLAGDLALSLQARPDFEPLCRARYEAALSRALATAVGERQQEAPRTNRYLASRG